ncbi:MAG: hypothetical protein ACRDHW_07035, partial [Ktedonobacteraceae bacterium]
MPEDPNALPDQPGEAQPAQPASGQPAPANAEQYPPSPSFYERIPMPDPYGAPAINYNAAPQPAVPGTPPMMPPPGYSFMPPPGAPPMMPPPGYSFMPPPGTPPMMPPPGYSFMPPPGYGAPPMMPPPGYSFAPPPGYDFMPPLQISHPLPLNQAVRELPRQYWKILAKPGVRAFAEEHGKAEWGII